MVPPAPPLFSMTMLWPSVCASAFSESRATTSPPVPGASGTIAWIGFDGQFAEASDCAKDGVTALP